VSISSAMLAGGTQAGSHGGREPTEAGADAFGTPMRGSGGNRRPTAILQARSTNADAASGQRVGGSSPPGGVVGGSALHDGVAGGYETVSLAVGFTSTTTVRPSRRKASVGSTTHSSPSNTQPGQSSGLPAASTTAPG
jgi:hypothetical protein